MALFGLFVGINHYHADEAPNLDYAEADATEVHGLMTELDTRWHDDTECSLLLGPDATKVHIQTGLRTLAKFAGPDDDVVVMFSGHGCFLPYGRKGAKKPARQAFLLPVDANVKDIAGSSISFEMLGRELRNIRCGRILVILDCCHSGAAHAKTIVIPGTKAFVEVDPSYVHEIATSGATVLTACAADQHARESSDEEHGLFSYSLIQGLRGAADYRQDGVIDLDELWLFACHRTAELSENKQDPVRTGFIEGGTMFLSKSDTTAASEEERDRLCKSLVARFGLSTVGLATTPEDDSIAEVGAAELERRLENHMRVAVSCGRTLAQCITAMKPSNLVEVSVLPMNGHPTQHVEVTNSLVLSMIMLGKFGRGAARATVIPMGVPADVYHQEREPLQRETERVFSIALQSDVFIIGIGAVSESNDSLAIILDAAGLPNGALKDLGAAGEINFHPYDQDGVFLCERTDLDEDVQEKLDRYYDVLLAAPALGLREAFSQRGVHVIGVARGYAKRRAILGALRGRLVKTLITDVPTARWLERQHLQSEIRLEEV